MHLGHACLLFNLTCYAFVTSPYNSPLPPYRSTIRRWTRRFTAATDDVEHSRKGIPASRFKHFINLTNGIEALPYLLARGIPLSEISFIRIQSSHCESNDLQGVLEELDHNLLMNLALGQICIVYDFGSRGTKFPDGTYGVSRSIWMGLEWIRYVLLKMWEMEGAGKEKVFIRGYNVAEIFKQRYNAIPKSLRKKFKYYRPFLRTKHLYLFGANNPTDMDKGLKDPYVHMLHGYYANGSSSSGSGSTDDDNNEEAYVEEAVAAQIPQPINLFLSKKYDAMGRSAPSKQDKSSQTKNSSSSTSSDDSNRGPLQ